MEISTQFSVYIKKIVFAVFAFLLFTLGAKAQVIFNEDFGQTTVRQTSPYMPSGSYTFGDPDPSATLEERAIENNHYAVIDPTHIRDAYPTPYYWLWTGPEPTGNTSGGAGNPATDDHTAGDTNGAVLAINAGLVEDYFYVRPVSLNANTCYKLSYWVYLVNSSSRMSLEVRDVADQTILETYDTGFLSDGDVDVWTEVSIEFKIPAGCTSTDVEIALRNDFATTGGNDYYIDDIKLEQLATCTASEIGTCPTGSLVNTSGPQVSDNGLFSVTKQSDVSSVPSGGGTVNYTYTVTNLTGNRIYYLNNSDDKCPGMSLTASLPLEPIGLFSSISYLAPNATATWTCTAQISETTTNTATFQFAGSYSTGLLGSVSYNNVGTATASVTVVRTLPAGALSCNTLWYSSDEYSTYGFNGELGTMVINAGGTSTSTTSIADYQTQTGSTQLEGSAGMAMDPADPTKIYYIPREDLGESGSTWGGLYVYDLVTGTSTLVSSDADTPNSVRLGMDPNGLLWTVLNGIAYSFDPTTNLWTDRGLITLPTGFAWSTLGSGDLAFDGNGTMYLVASDTTAGVGQLFTITQSELLDGVPAAEYVGEMGPNSYNGIGFTEDGVLYATSASTSGSFLYTINIATGAASAGIPINNLFVTDVASCALPKAILSATKSAAPDGTLVKGDEITYTIEVCNNGSLASTGTTFQDLIPAGTTYVANSTTQNGVAVPDVSGNMPYVTETKINSDGENAGSIGQGECATIVFKVTINNDFTGTEICNQGSVDYTYNDGVFLTDDTSLPGGADPTCSFVQNPLIAIAKSAPITNIIAAQDVTYTYEVTNVGTDVLTNVTVTDDKCTTVTYISGDANSDNKLQTGETWIYECTTNISAETTNIATASAVGEETGLTTTDTDTWTITSNATTLDITKTASPAGVVNPDDTITYTIVVENTGTKDATNVTLDDVLPTGVTYVAGTAQKTYYPTPPLTSTGSTTKNLNQLDFNAGGPFNNTVSFTAADGIPAGATLTGIEFSINGTSFPDGGFFPNDAQRDDIEMILTYPSGTIDVDRGTDPDGDDNEFGPASDGTWDNVTRNITASGTAIGDYVFAFYDDANQDPNPENRVSNSSTITIYWTDTPQITDAANAPENMVTAADAITLAPGETLTVTFDALVGYPDSGSIVNTATANSDAVLTPVSDTATNTFENPCTLGGSTDGNPTPLDNDGDGVIDSCDLDDDNDGILDTDEYSVCIVSPALAGQSGEGRDWTVGATDVFTTGDIEDGTGQISSGFALEVANTFGQDISTLVDESFSVSGSNFTFTGGTGTLTSTCGGNLEVTSLGQLLADDAGNGLRINPCNADGQHWTLDISPTGSPQYFGFNLIDLYDVGSDSYNLDYRILVNGVEVWNLNGTTISSGTQGPIALNDGTNSQGTATVGDSHENFIGFIDPNGITSIRVEMTTSGRSFGDDVIGMDGFIVGVPPCYTIGPDTDGDGIPNQLDTDSDNDGCPDATEGANSLPTTGTLAGGSIGGSEANLGTTVNTNGIPTTATGGDVNGTEVAGQDTTPGVTINEVLAIDSVTSSVTMPICENTNIIFTANASGTSTDFSTDPDTVSNLDPNTDISYQWYESTDGGTTFTLLTGKTSKDLALTNVAFSTPAKQYKIEITSANNSCPTEEIITLEVNALDDASFTLTNYCFGAANSATITGTSGGTFTFDPAVTDGATVDASTGTITNGVAGQTYTLRYTTSGPCPVSSTQTVSVNALDTATFTLTDYCFGAANSATITGTTGGTFAFNPAVTDGATVNASTGEITNGVGGTTYTLEYTTTGVCAESSTQTVTVSELPVIDTPADQALCNTTDFTMAQSISVGTGTWTTTNTDISITDINDPTTTVTGLPAGTSATLTWTAVNGTCSVNDQVTITHNICSLTVDKTQISGPNPVTAAGDILNYSIVVNNDGNTTLTGVNVVDTLPDGSTGTLVGPTETLTTDGVFEAGETWTYTISYTVSQTDAASIGTTLVNTASVTTTELPIAEEDTAETPIDEQSDIATVKSSASATYVPGTDVTYTITVTNNGPSTASSVSVADAAPAGTTITSWTASATGTATFTASGSGDISETITDMSNGAVVTYTIVVAVPSDFTGDLTNTATVTNPEDPTPDCDDCTETDTEDEQSDIATVKSSASATYVPGTDVTYTITVTNNGPSTASSVSVADAAPAGTTITSWTASATGTATFTASGSGDISETITDMSNGAVVTYTIVVAVPSDFTGDLTNTATVMNPEDPTPDCDDCTETDTEDEQSDIATVKSSASATYVPGTDVTYTITVTNNGPSTASSVSVADAAPAGTTITSWTASATGTATFTASGSGDISETITDMSNGAVVTYTIVVAVPSDFTGDLTNTATVTNPEDPTPDCDDCTETDTEDEQSDIATVKSSASATYVPGTDVTYTITVTNNGPSTASSVSVADAAPAGTTITSWTASATGTATFTASGSGDISETITDMSNGAVVTYTIVVAVPSDFTGDLTNTATVTNPEDPTPDCDDCTETDTEDEQSDIATVKSSASATYVPGTDVTYTITVTNNGPSTASSVSVADAAPAGTTITSWTASATGTATFTASGSGDISETITDMSNGAVVTYTIVVAVPSDFTGDLTNTATVTNPEDPTPDCDDCTETDTEDEQSDIATVKSSVSDTYVPGTDVTYTITVTNNGPSTASSVSVADAAPAGTTITSWTASATGTATFTASGSGDISETITDMSNGAVVTYTIVVAVPSDFTGDLTNTATVMNPEDPTPDCDDCTETDTEDEQSDIATVKSSASATYVPGTDVTYTITVTNNGPSTASSVSVADAAPAGTTITSWTASATGTATFTASGSGDISETITDMSNGAVVTYTIVVAVPSDFTGDLTNTATVTNPEDPTPDCDDCTETDTEDEQSDIATVKSSASATYVPGTDVTYTITVTNNGPSTASSVSVADAAPAGTTITSWTASATGTATFTASGSGDISETITDMSNGAVVTYTIVVAVPSDFTGDLTNTATVTNPEDPTPDCDDCTETDTEDEQSDIATVKSSASATYVPGTDVTYTITVTNNGPSTASSVSVADAAPAGTTITSWTASATGTATFTASGSGDISETITDMSNGAVVTYTIVVAVPSDFTGDLTNTATVTNPEDPTPDCDDCTETDTEDEQSDIATVKSSASATYVPGTDVTYTITVTNNGPSTASSVSVADAAPAGTTITSWTASATGTATFTASGSGDISETITDMSNGAVVTYTIVVAVPSDFTGDLTNTATVTNPEDPTPDCDDCTETDTEDEQSDIATVKSSASATYVPGTDVTYTITVTNNGPSTASSVSVADAAPAGTTITSWTASATGTATFTASGSGDISETITDMSNGAVVTYTIVVAVPSDFTGDLTNTATVTNPEDPTPDCDDCTETDTEDEQSDIATVKSSASATYVPGTDVTYTITVTNNGPSTASSVSVADAAPAGTTITSWTASATGTATFTASGSGDISETITDMSNGAVVTYTIVVAVPSDFTGDLTNTATVMNPEDPTPDCDDCTETDTEDEQSDIATVKSSASATYVPGTDVTYTITVTNNGPSTASSVSVADAAPAGTTITSWTASATGTATFTASGSGDISETITDMSNGAVVTYTIVVAVPSDFTGDLTNTATVTNPEDPTPDCDDCTETDTEDEQSDIATVKSSASATYVPGTDVTYTITVTNNGPSTASSVSVADAAPAGTTITSWTASATGTATFTASGSGDISETITDMSNGAVVTYTIVVAVPSDFTGDLTNTATVTNPEDPTPDCDDCTETDTEDEQSDIATVKSSASATYVPGTDVTYTITVTNNGPSTASSVSVADAAPAGTTITSWTASATGTATFTASGSGDISETITDMSNGAVVTYTIVVAVPSDFTGDLTNTATVTNPEDPTPDCDDCTETDTEDEQSDIATVKSSASATYVPGTDVTYTITVTNNGPSTASSVSVADAAPAGTTITSWTASATGTATFTASGSGDISETITDMSNGAVVTYTIVVAVPSDFTGDLTNTATVTNPEDPTPDCDDCTETDTEDEQSDIATVKSSASATYVPGTDVTYTITVTNNGPSTASSVSVADAAPAGTTITSWTASATGTATFTASGSGDISETITDMSNGAVVTYTIVVAVPSDFTGDLTNTATVTNPEDPTPDCDDCTETDTEDEQSDIATVKSSVSDTYVPGTDVTYTITVTNNGPSTASSVSVADAAPAGTTITSWTASATGTATFTASGSGDISETITDMSNGAVVTYTIVVAVPSDFTGDLTNTATVTNPEDPTPDCDDCTETDTEDEQSDIATVKSSASATYVPGTDVTYTITVTNNGPSTASSVSVADAAPAGTTITSWTASATGTATFTASGSGDISETITDMSNGAVVTYTIVVAVPSDFTGDLTNTATVTNPEDPTPDCDDCTETDTEDEQSDIATVKSSASATYVPGTDVTYTITVTNNGPSTASSVSVADAAPAGTTITSWTASATGTATFTASGSGDISETITDMSNGAVVTYTIVVAVPSDFTGDLTNTATVTNPEDPTPDCDDCTETDTEDEQSDIATVKSSASATYVPGTDVTYTITVTNNGPSTASSVSVADAAPAGTTITSWTASATGTATFTASGSGDISETITDMSNGAVVTYTIVVAVPSDFTGDLTNTATVTNPEDPTPDCDDCTETDTEDEQSDIATVKSSASATYVPGTDVTYTITVTNNGPSTASSVSVADAAPAGTTITSWTASATGTATFTASGSGDISETITDMSNGAVVTYTIVVAVPSDFTGDLTNTATVTNPEDPTPDCDDCTETDTEDEQSDIATVKSSASATYVPGTDVTYTITVTNNGPSTASSVSVADAAPAGTTITSWTASATGTATFTASGSGDISETITDMSNGAVVTYTIVVAVPSDFTGDLTNTATVMNPEDPTPDCDDCTETDTEDEQSDIATVKSSASATYVPGTDVTYTITVTNNGPSTASSVSVADAAPAGTTITSWTASATGTATFTASGSGDISETITDMSNGAVVTYTIVVAVPSDFTGDLTNTATVTNPEDPTPDCDDCTETDTEDEQSDIATVKSSASATYVPGTDVTYTITVTNNGPSTASSVSVADAAPAGTTITSWTASATGTATFTASGSGDISETITDMSNGAVVTYTIVVAVPSDFTGDLTNTATVMNPEDPTPDCDDCTETDTPAYSADVVTVKTNNATEYIPGTNVTYTITVTNNGPSDASDVSVSDPLPTGITEATWSGDNGTSGVGALADTITTLADGATVTYTVILSVPADFTEELVNVVEVTTPTPDPDPTCPDCTDGPDTPAYSADVVTVKTNNATEYIPGTNVTYTITVTNNGPSDASDVSVSDPLPTGITEGTWSGDNGTSGVGALADTITTLADGATVTYTVILSVPADFTEELVNVVEVTTPTPDPDPTCPDCTDGPDTRHLDPDAVDDMISGNVPGDTVSLPLLPNDTLSDGSPATVDNTTIELVDPATGLPTTAPVVVPGEGTWTLDPTTGTITFDPEDGFTSDATPIDYVLTETSTGLTDTATIAVDYTEQAPVANDDMISGNVPGDTVSLPLLPNDTLSDGSPATVDNTTIELVDSATGLPTTAPVVVQGEGIWTLDPTTGTLTFDPEDGFITSPTPIDYVLTETGTGLTDIASVVINTLDINPSLEVTKTAEVNGVSAIDILAAEDDVITYTITVENTGDITLTDITLDDVFTDADGNTKILDVEPTFDSASQGSSEGTLLAGEVATYIASYTVTLADVLTTTNIESVINSVIAEGVAPNGTRVIDVSDNGDDTDGNTVDDPTEVFLAAVADATDCIIYNEFSPNGDGDNDYFIISESCLEANPNNNLEIFNRWGNSVYKVSGYKNDWDGTSNGRSTINQSDKLPVGTYFYVLDLGDGSGPKTGWLYLNR